MPFTDHALYVDETKGKGGGPGRQGPEITEKSIQTHSTGLDYPRLFVSFLPIWNTIGMLRASYTNSPMNVVAAPSYLTALPLDITPRSTAFFDFVVVVHMIARMTRTPTGLTRTCCHFGCWQSFLVQLDP